LENLAAERGVEYDVDLSLTKTIFPVNSIKCLHATGVNPNANPAATIPDKSYDKIGCEKEQKVLLPPFEVPVKKSI
jgi:hypothetical protein